MFWPTTQEYVDEMMEALIEKMLPFVLSLASPRAKVPEELVKKLEDSKIGLLTKWAPQQYVLNHPAVGWFLTHGGHGGITEALGSGIPMIGWPFTGDQPIAIAQLSENQGVLIELFEVRNSDEGRRLIHRLGHAPIGTREAVGVEIREVIDKLRGEEGKDIQLNAARLKKEFMECWKEGGEGKRELQAFLVKYVDEIGRQTNAIHH